MSIKNFIILLGLSVFVAGCSNMQGQEEQITGTPSEMGRRYLIGQGVQQNNEKAFMYFKKAANQGDPFAKNELAYLYATGKGTTRDESKAFYYYHQAAERGLASAQYNLGLMYKNGVGTPKDPVQADEWLARAAAHGFLPAKNSSSQTVSQ